MERLGTDARTTRLAEGLTQAQVAGRARVSQASVSRLEAGDELLSTLIVGRIFGALGMHLSLRAYPGPGVPLRDSGQLALAEVIRPRAHPGWRVTFEAPTGDSSGQAADLVLATDRWGIHIELETRLVDFQAQLRRSQLKRDALQQHRGVPLALVLAVRDSERNRAAVRSAPAVIRAALPAGSRDVLAAIEHGTPLGRDGLLWVRT